MTANAAHPLCATTAFGSTSRRFVEPSATSPEHRQPLDHAMTDDFTDQEP
jgi:hypothetical protein